MISVIGVRFQQDGKMIYYDASVIHPQTGDYVIAETIRGLELGEVVQGTHELEEDQISLPLPQLLRIATQQDIQQATDNRVRERDAYQICQRKIAEHKLEMKLVSVESTFDNGKMLFYFTANGRVDFRALVKDLAATFRTRIELRQIGVRDEARMLGGLGSCGRPICCGSFLNDFQPVSIKMAKEQNLSLNPVKISGVCGRLMCCLKYEQEQYEETRKRMPRLGREVMTPDGSGQVSELNIIRETVKVRIPSGDTFEVREYPLDQIIHPKSGNENDPPATEIPVPEELPDDPELSAIEDSETVQEEQAEPVRKRKQEPGKPPRVRKPRTEKNYSRTGSKSQKGTAMPAEKENNDMPSARGKNGGRGKAPREQAFGQPVRRENPEKERKPVIKTETTENRPQDAPASRNSVSQAKTSQENAAGKNTPAASKSKGWADALEKALQAADR